MSTMLNTGKQSYQIAAQYLFWYRIREENTVFLNLRKCDLILMDIVLQIIDDPSVLIAEVDQPDRVQEGKRTDISICDFGRQLYQIDLSIADRHFPASGLLFVGNDRDNFGMIIRYPEFPQQRISGVVTKHSFVSFYVFLSDDIIRIISDVMLPSYSAHGRSIVGTE